MGLANVGLQGVVWLSLRHSLPGQATGCTGNSLEGTAEGPLPNFPDQGTVFFFFN